jgi:hypothetical protein
MGSEDQRRRSPEELRAGQERELGTSYALASMEHALAREAFHIGVELRRAGIELDPMTFVALRVLEACVGELIDPSEAIGELVENGSLQRSVELANGLLENAA